MEPYDDAPQAGAPGLAYGLAPSGFEFLDRETGGLRPGKRYVFFVTEGAERYLTAIQTARAALESGEVVLFMTAEDPEALLVQAKRTEIPIARFVHGDQLILLAYDRRFSELVSNPTLQDGLLEDLRRKTNNRPINRVIMLGEPRSAGANIKLQQAIGLLESHFLHDQGAILINILDADSTEERAGDMRRAAFGVFDLRSSPDDNRYRCAFRVLKEPSMARGGIKVWMGIQPRVGLQPEETDEDVRLLYVGDDKATLADLNHVFAKGFDIARYDYNDDLTEIVKSQDSTPIIVLQISESSEPSRVVIGTIEELRVTSSAPIVAISRGRIRSADRLFLYRAGVDDVISADVALAEIRERILRQAVRERLLKPRPVHELRLQAGEDLPRTEGHGLVPWGVFSDSLARTLRGMDAHTGQIALLSINVRSSGDEAHRERVFAYVTKVLGVLLRQVDAGAVSPEGNLVLRLFNVGRTGIDSVVARLRGSINPQNIPGTEVTIAAARFPQDGREAEELLGQLRNPDRKVVFEGAGAAPAGQRRAGRGEGTRPDLEAPGARIPPARGA